MTLRHKRAIAISNLHLFQFKPEIARRTEKFKNEEEESDEIKNFLNIFSPFNLHESPDCVSIAHFTASEFVKMTREQFHL